MPRFISWLSRRGRPVSEQDARQARIDAKLRAIEQQGAHSVSFAHGLAYLLVVAFSAGSLITLAGDAINHFMTQAQHGVVDIPSLISFTVSFALVFAMDTAMVIAAATVRMYQQRRQPGAGVHIAVIIGVCIMESATYLYMSYVFDHPVGWVAWTILTARACAAPLIAVYLSLANTLPVSARDINTQVEVVTGRGVLMEMTRIADDPHATTERKVALYRASAVMDPTDASRLDAIIQAERQTRDDATISKEQAPTQPALPAISAAPAKPLSRHDARRAALESDMFGVGVAGRNGHVTSPRATRSGSWDDDDFTTDAADDADGADDWGAYGDDGVAALNHNHRAEFRQQVNPNRGASSAARMSPRLSEMVVDLPTGKTALKTDTPEARKVMNYLDKHPGATITDVVARTKVSKPTVRRHYTAWIERNKRLGEVAAPFTQELPAVIVAAANGSDEG